jgi:hypothetical protein
VEANALLVTVEESIPTTGDVVEIAESILDYIKTNIFSKTRNHTIVIDVDGAYELNRPTEYTALRTQKISLIVRWLLQGVAVVSAMMMEVIHSNRYPLSLSPYASINKKLFSFLSLSLSLSLSHTHSLSHSPSLSFTLPHSPSLSIYLHLSPSISIYLTGHRRPSTYHQRSNYCE